MIGDHAPRLLIIDDDVRTQDALRRLFTITGWEVESASTTAEGLSKLEPPPRCVLLDLSLPDETGESVLRTIRESNRPIRVVVCTGYDDPARLAAVRSLGPDAILTKPVDPDELLRACGPDGD